MKENGGNVIYGVIFAGYSYRGGHWGTYKEVKKRQMFPPGSSSISAIMARFQPAIHDPGPDICLSRMEPKPKQLHLIRAKEDTETKRPCDLPDRPERGLIGKGPEGDGSRINFKT